MEQSKVNLKINTSDEFTIHYKGDVAKLYNKNRTSSLKWKREQKIMEKIISNFSSKSIILDLPIGTGRLLPFYKSRNHKIYGIDISPDMLAETSKAIKGTNTKIDLIEGNIEKIPLPENSVDYVVCMRLFNLVPFSTLKIGLKEFCRVSRDRIFFQVRVIEDIGLIKLMAKMALDSRTHINRLIHQVFISFEKTLNIIKGLSNKGKNEIIKENYYLHRKEDIYDVLRDEGFDIVRTIEVDKGMDFTKRLYKPFLIIECKKN